MDTNCYAWLSSHPAIHLPPVPARLHPRRTRLGYLCPHICRGSSMMHSGRAFNIRNNKKMHGTRTLSRWAVGSRKSAPGGVQEAEEGG